MGSMTQEEINVGLFDEVKRLQTQLQAKNEECDGLRAQVERLQTGLTAMNSHLNYIPALDLTVDELLKETPTQSLSAIRNEAIREGWDMCMDKVLHHLNQWTHSTGKMALQSVKQISYPQLTEEE